MKKILLTIAIIFGIIQMTGAIGTMTSVYLDPVGGNDDREAAVVGTLLYPVKTWDKALSLAANNATIYVTWGSVPITTSTAINGAQYGATNITVTPYTGYTGALFAIADGATGTFTNITLKGTGTAQALLTVNSGGTLTIGSSLKVSDGGQISLDGGANPINLNVTPASGTNYQLLTKYEYATDEARAIVNAGSVSNSLQYFTLITPVATATAEYELALDGTTIRLYERPLVGIYLDPLQGNDAYSGAQSNRSVKTLTRALAIWNSRYLTVPDLTVYILSRVNLTEDVTLDNGIKIARFAADANWSTNMTDTMIIYSGHEVTINNATISNGSLAGSALHSGANGRLTLNNGAKITSANAYNIIVSHGSGTVTMNDGASITSTGTSGYSIYVVSTSAASLSTHVIINGGTITTNGDGIYKYYGTMTIDDFTITSGRSAIYHYYGTTTINNATVTSTGTGNSVLLYYGTSTVNNINITSAGTSLYLYGGTTTIYDADITHSGTSYCIYNSATTTIHDMNVITAGTNSIYNISTLTINGGTIKNERTSTGNTINNYTSGRLTMNGGTVDAGITTALYNTSTTANAVILNKCNLSSTNTANGTIYSTYTIIMNGEEVNINGGIIYFNTTGLESYNIIINSATVTQNYTIRISTSSSVPYTALVKSNPVIDLGLYENKFTLEPRDNYLLAAYANKGEPNRNLVLYRPNGIYVSDFTGNDANSGISPTSPVKTLANAATKTTTTKTQIYICDSTLTINSAQNAIKATERDTISPYMFRTSAYLMHITTGGSLTLENMAIYTTSTLVSGYIRMTSGSLTLNDEALLITYGKYGIYQEGGNVTMNDGSLIKYAPTGTSTSGYGIYQTGTTASATLNKGAVIERQSYAIRLTNASHVDIKDSAVIQNCSYAVYMAAGGTVNIDSAIIQNGTTRAIHMNNGGTVNIGKAIIQGYTISTANTLYVNNGIMNLNGTTIRNSGYRVLSMTGATTVVTMTDGKIINNGYQGNVSSATYQGAVYIENQATFNFNGGLIAENNIPLETNSAIYGEQVHILTGGKMNFIKGEIRVSKADRNAIYVFASDTTLTRASHLTLSNEAILDSGFIYCNSTKYAPITLSNSLSSSRIYNIFLGDNMAGRVVVDGTSPGTVPASVNNFVLSPELTTLSLKQSGNDVVVGSDAIYLDGVSGNDLNDGSSAATAVRTFTKAKELLLAADADVIIIVGSAMLNNTNESSIWDLSENPNAVLQRATGYTGYLIQIQSGRSLTLSNITIDGNKDNFASSVSHAIYGTTGALTVNSGATIKNNRAYGIYMASGTLTINGGEVSNHTSYGIYTSGTTVRINGGEISNNTSYGIYSGSGSVTMNGGKISNNAGQGLYVTGANFSMHGGTIANNSTYGLYMNSSSTYSFIMTGGSITENGNYGVYNTYCKYVRLSGGEISKNNSHGIYTYYNGSSGIVEISGTAKITENKGAGISVPSSSSYYLDSLIISGGEISNNTSYGIQQYASRVSITGGNISGNGGNGITVSSSGSNRNFTMTGGVIANNTAGYGLSATSYTDLLIKDVAITGNSSYGVTTSGSTTATIENIESSGNGAQGGTFSATNLSIEDSDFKNNKTFGMSISSTTTTLSIKNVDITDNTTYGLSISSAANANVTIEDVNITNNGTYGATISSNSGILSLENVNITDNRNYGATISNVSTLSLENVTIAGNSSYGINLSVCTNMLIGEVDVSNNGGYGIQTTGNTITNQGSFTMTSGTIDNNNGFGISFNNSYLVYDISGDVEITNNKNSGIYSNSLLPSSISGDVLIKGNRTTLSTSGYGGGLYVYQGTVNVSDNVLFEADTSMYYGGAIYVRASATATLSGNVRIKDCVITSTNNSTGYGGGAIYALGNLSMTGGSITGCEAINSNGTVYVSGTSSNVNLTRVKISDNTARYGGAVYINSGGRITLDTDTIVDNITSAQSFTNPVTGVIHVAGSSSGRLLLRDKCSIEGPIFLTYASTDVVYVDEALLSSAVAAFQLLGNNSVTNPGTVVVSPNGTTVTDASQFLSKFTLMNENIGRGLDKGGTDDKHIIIVNQFFIDGTVPDGTNNGANPLTAFNKISQMNNVLNTAYTTVWVSGPVTVTGDDVLPTITATNVNLRRYTGFAVAARLFPEYDSVMITINEGASLAIPGGNSAANKFTISGEGGSSYTDASIFKNNGTLTIGGHVNLYFNPIGGHGAAIYQNGTFNLSGNVEFELYSVNTVYLPENRVIHIDGVLTTTTPIGITVETSPANTHIPGRIVATGTTTHIPAGLEDLFYNEITPGMLPIGRVESGTTANLIFYIADRNVSGVPVYTTLQDAFDAAISADNDEVRLYGNTEEAVIVDKTLKYNSQGYPVLGSFTLDSTSNVQLLDELLADTLFIRATMFSNKAQFDLNTQDVTISKAAYLDLRLPEGIVISDWYPVNLPFDANITDVRNADDTTTLILHLQDYAVATYDGQRRANYGIGNQPSNPDNDWQYFTGSQMTNGTGYMVTTKGIRALRFKAANLNLFAATTAPMTYFVGSAGSTHQGINYIPQPLPINSTITAGISNGGVIQVSEDLSSDRIGAGSYVAKTVSSTLVVAPYTNFFHQTGASGTVSYTKSTAAATVRSGVSSDVPAYYELRLYADNPERYDAFFAAASEYASEDDYEIGRDVVKMGTVGQGAMQIWSKDFDVALCANEVKLKNSSADIPLFIHTPIAGKEYTLRLHNVVSYNEQLWLCRADKLVQNLTLYPEYIIEGTGDTSEAYSLKLLSGMTHNEPTGTGEIYVYTENKTIIIVGLHPGDDYLIFDTAGRLHKSGKADSNRTRISAGSGTYVIQTKTNDKTFKAIVK